MSKRTKGESLMWDNKIRTMFKEIEGSGLVKNRYKAIRWLLMGRYSDQNFAEKEKTTDMLRDAIYLDRKLRLWTETKEQPLKEQLSQEFQVSELGYRI